MTQDEHDRNAQETSQNRFDFLDNRIYEWRITISLRHRLLGSLTILSLPLLLYFWLWVFQLLSVQLSFWLAVAVLSFGSVLCLAWVRIKLKSDRHKKFGDIRISILSLMSLVAVTYLLLSPAPYVREFFGASASKEPVQ